jgi:glycosyltransferase involved in cell wall biosynthesis
VLAQTYQNWEIVFWDNQSIDGSAEIFKSYSDPRFRYFYAPTHLPLYGARNYAIDQARGAFLAFLDVDDWWIESKLEWQIPLFSEPQVGLVCGNYWVVSEQRNRRWIRHKRPMPTGHVLNELLESYFPGLLTLVVRRSALESLDHRCDPRYHMIGDLDLVVRLSIRWKLACVQEPVAFYRKHEVNDSAKHIGRHVGELECWMGEMAQVEPIRSSPGWSTACQNLTYLKALGHALRRDKRAGRQLFHELPWGALKLRLLGVLLLPSPLALRFKN